MSNEDARRRMGQYAEQLSHRFDLTEIVSQWHELHRCQPTKKMTQPKMD